MAEFTITEEERLALKANFDVYLGKKPLEDDLQSQLKHIKEERAAAQRRVQATMSEKRIPICKSADYGYQVSLINKKRKAAPKASDYLDTVEQMYGAAKRKQVDQETKRRCTDIKEAQTLKLVKLDASGASAKKKPSASGSAAQEAAEDAPPRYDEEDGSDESK